MLCWFHLQFALFTQCYVQLIQDLKYVFNVMTVLFICTLLLSIFLYMISFIDYYYRNIYFGVMLRCAI